MWGSPLSLAPLLFQSSPAVFSGTDPFCKVMLALPYLFYDFFLLKFCSSDCFSATLGTLYRNPTQTGKVDQSAGAKLLCTRKEPLPSVHSKNSGKEAV